MKQLATHLYELDQAAHADHRGERPCKHCPLPRGNRVHNVPDTAEAQAEHLRRIGEDQDQ